MKKYELSLTRRYVSSWGINEAVRELLQNAYDEGNEEIKISGDCLTIINHNAKIGEETLVLGNTGKSNDDSKVGCYGEGYKLALLVLLRNGYSVKIHNNDVMWIPTFNWSESFNTEILCIEETPIESNGNVSFIISGLPKETIVDLEKEFIGINGESYEKIETSYGEILIDEKFSGRMFVEGLPIMCDNKFKYGYNFNANVVNLDRDRKSINLRELYKICAQTITTVKDDYSFVDSLIEGKTDDATYIKDRSISFNDDFVSNYCQFLTDKFEVKENSVVVNKENEEMIKEIKSRQANGDDIDLIVTNKTVQADVINRVNTFSANYLNNVHNEVNSRTRKEKAENEFDRSELKDLLEWYLSIESKLTKEEKIDLYENVLQNIEPYDFYQISEEIYERYKVIYE